MKTVYSDPWPHEPRPDEGPKGYAGAFTGLLTFIFVLLLVTITLAMVLDPPSARRTEFLQLIGGATLVTGLLTAVAWKFHLASRRYRRELPQLVDVLRGPLGFRPGSHAAICFTAFFHPGRAPAGGQACLLIFAQNLMTRRRRLTIDLLRNPKLGVKRLRRLHLNIGAGEAVVYRMILKVDPETTKDSLVAKLILRQSAPAGEGVRHPLVGNAKPPASTSLFNMATAQPPLAILPSLGWSPDELPREQYLSIYTPQRGEPNYELLRLLTETPAGEEINLG